jgi:hypothetical protein
MIQLSRRAVFKLGLAAGLTPGVVRPAKANALGTRFGAIRWDGYYSSAVGDVAYYTQAILSYPDYQFRAPFFATKTSAGVMTINGNLQATMDSEIAYAAAAGVKYWAYNWYGTSAGQPLGNAWRLHQASATKADVNWCLLPSYTQFHTDIAGGTSTYTGFFLQSNYEKIAGQPLVYLLSDSSTTPATLAADVTALRAACVTAGCGDPYIVVMDFTPSTAAASKTTMGANAISNYARAGGGGTAVSPAFSVLSASQIAFWATQAATGALVVPVITAGWNQSPMKNRTLPSYSAAFRTKIGLNQGSVVPPTGAELASVASSLLTWMAANPASVTANTALIYAWNEFTEGGYICPRWTSGSPDTTYLDALSPVIS